MDKTSETLGIIPAKSSVKSKLEFRSPREKKKTGQHIAR